MDKNLNSPRSLEFVQFDKQKATILEEKIKELSSKNEHLEKEVLKYKMKTKNLEDSAKLKHEKEYIVK